MSHMNIKHLNKSDDELIYRMLTEWKVNIGCFYNDITDILRDDICIEKFSSEEGAICIYKFDEVVGYGFNRKLEKIETCYARIVYDANGQIITGYPELDLGYIVDNKYEVNTDALISIAEEKGDISKHFSSKIWDFFLRLKKELNLEIRFISTKKNPQLRIYFKSFTMKINKNSDLKIYNDGDLYLSENKVNNIYNYVVNFVS